MFYNNIIAAWVLIAASVSSAQMVEFDVSIGQFYIECSKGAYCLIDENSTFGLFALEPTVEEDESRFSPSTGYYFAEDGGDLGGFCNSGACYSTCDEACVCVTDPTNVLVIGSDNSTSFNSGGLSPDSPNAVPCAITESFPDADIATPDEFVTYESSVQSPGRLAVRCTDQYATCTSPGNSQFTSVATVSGDYSYARDFQDCSPVDGICYMSCDPRCECQETNAAGETLPCKEGTPPTSSPTVAPATETAASPAPTAASAAASTTHVRSTIAILGSLVATIVW
ncbi:unknown protein [Seminavis robusta]|uniref:Uncharacterized protein n=1 Tax=Seminavis robusta TaxID=568900 RepID=A0A9N8F490_9STRA|nr:unknown protein [Seminavis robusta]|eukprot:Sro3468_g348350.1 n/a (283) ;mRNA; r:1612-2460